MRRFAILLVCLLTGAGHVDAQERDRVYRVSVLAEGRAIALTRSVVIPELAKRGFEEGRNLIVETKPTGGVNIDALVSALAAFNPDAIIFIGSHGLAAVSQGIPTIPVVALGPDFIELGYAESLSRPKGNVTGRLRSSASYGPVSRLCPPNDPHRSRWAAGMSSDRLGNLS